MPQLFLKTKRSTFMYEPLGVIGVISPWNYPWSIPFGEVALALMAGNGVVLKPASLTPLIGERIAAVFERAGVPEGLVRVVHGPGPARRWSESERRQGVLHRLGRDRARGRRGVRPAAQGLGARARRQGPDDRAGRRQPRARDRRRAVGRLCECRPDLLGDRARVRAARGGRPLHRRGRRGRAAAAGRRPARAGTPRSARWSPASSSSSSRELVDDAVAAGAALRCGGPVERSPTGLDGAFYAPTVLTGVTHEMRIMREEIFGPVLPIIVVDSEDEAVALANDSRVRARRVGVDDGSRQGRADRARARVRDGLDQRPHVQPRRLPVLVGRGQGVGPRPHPLQVRPVRVRQRQAARVGALDRAQPVVAPLRRDPRPRAAARPRRSSTAGRRSAPRALRGGRSRRCSIARRAAARAGDADQAVA